MIFIDADKASIPEYFTWALKRARPGALILVDNVIRNGAVIDASSTDPHIIGVRRFNEMLSAERRGRPRRSTPSAQKATTGSRSPS
jgi:Predicted O-methyltransferase